MESEKKSRRKSLILTLGSIFVVLGLLIGGLFASGILTNAGDAKQVLKDLDYDTVGDVISVDNWEPAYEQVVAVGVKITVLYDEKGESQARLINQLATKLRSFEGVSCSQEEEYFYECMTKDDVTVFISRSNLGGVKLIAVSGYLEG